MQLQKVTKETSSIDLYHFLINYLKKHLLILIFYQSNKELTLCNNLMTMRPASSNLHFPQAYVNLLSSYCIFSASLVDQTKHVDSAKLFTNLDLPYLAPLGEETVLIHNTNTFKQHDQENKYTHADTIYCSQSILQQEKPDSITCYQVCFCSVL